MTTQGSQAPALSNNVFLILRELIHEQTGLYFGDDKRETLAERLARRVADPQFGSYLDYYYHLKYDAEAAREWRHVCDALAVPETYFWREIDQIRALVDHIVPEYFAMDRPAPLRIWSAACSTGEEPLSIAMALAEAGWSDPKLVEIWASDASSAALSAARRGLYRERSFRSLPPELRRRYFRETPAGSQISSDIHQRVQWTESNLVDPAQVRILAAAPVIFCRNAFIYFSTEAIQKTVRLFWDAMPRPAYLFVGVSESLLNLDVEFELREVDQAFAYVKP